MRQFTDNSPEQDVAAELELANRERLVAHAVADLHFVDRILEADYASASPQLVTDEAGPLTLPLNRVFELYPTRYSSEERSRVGYFGFIIDTAVASGGARNVLVYDKPSRTRPAAISMLYEEFTLMTTTVDHDGVSEQTDVASIPRSEYDTSLFVNRASAALNLRNTTPAQRDRLAKQAVKDRERSFRRLLG